MRQSWFTRVLLLLLVFALLASAVSVFAQEGGEGEGEADAVAQVETAQEEASNSQWLTILMFFAGLGAIFFVGLLTLVRRGAINLQMPTPGSTPPTGTDRGGAEGTAH